MKEVSTAPASGFEYKQQLARFSGRKWSVIATPTTGYIAERRSLFPYTIAIFGILFVSLGASYTFAVLERTNDLNDAKKKLETLALTDALTNIANRRCFDERLEAEWKRATREKTSLSLIMIDIDHFKLFYEAKELGRNSICVR